MKGAALTSCYDCLSVLSNAAEFKLYPELVMKILNVHWLTIGNTERRLLPLLECMDNAVRALGTQVQPFINVLFPRCVLLIQSQDSDFIQRSCNLISAIVTATKEHSTELLMTTGLLDKLIQ